VTGLTGDKLPPNPHGLHQGWHVLHGKGKDANITFREMQKTLLLERCKRQYLKIDVKNIIFRELKTKTSSTFYYYHHRLLLIV
jgi:hypothetical protein